MAKMAPALAQFLNLPEEQRVVGPYQLVRQLGKGGFAPVWLAREMYEGLELRTVAIKLFAPSESGPTRQSREGDRPTSMGTTQQQELLAEEARALCKVEHPNVVKFYSMTPRHAATGVVGLAMEYVSGVALDERLAEVGSLQVKDVVALGAAIASALAAVHNSGLVHRDVKPANVVETAGVYKLIDFGIARGDQHARHDDSEAKTRRIIVGDLPLETLTARLPIEVKTNSENGGESKTSIIPIGTPGYMDPDCLAHRTPATPSSDLYGLGVTLYECLVGAIPSVVAARDEGTHGQKREVVDGRVKAPPIAKSAPRAVPEALARLIDSLIEPDPELRPKSAEVVAAELERLRQLLSGRERVLPPESLGPFRGMQPMRGPDRDVFFGRSSETAASVEMLRTRGLLALVGTVGSGKRSLASAGIIPAVADGALGAWPKAWDAVEIRLGATPQADLLSALTPFLGSRSVKSPEALVELIARRAQTEKRGLVILVEQLESLLGVSAEADKRFVSEFIAAAAAWAHPGLRTVVTVAREYFDNLLSIPELGRALPRNTQLVSPLTHETWADVLDQSVGAYGYRLEDDELRGQLREQFIKAADAMPLVAFGLTSFWAERDTAASVLTRAALARIGGIHRTFELGIETAIARLEQDSPSEAAIVPEILLALLGPAQLLLAKTVEELQNAFPDIAVSTILSSLEGAGVVVCRGDRITLSHEGLFVHWKQLRNWFAEARERSGFSEEAYFEAFAGLGDNARIYVEEHLISPTGLRTPVAVAEATRDGLSADDIAVLEDRGILVEEERHGVRHVELAPEVSKQIVKRSRDERHAKTLLEDERSKTEQFQDQVRKQRLRTRIAGGAAVLCAIALVGTALGVNEVFYRVHKDYYETFVKRRGFVVGQIPLTEEQARHRWSSLELIWRGYHWEGSWPWKGGWYRPNPPFKMVAVNAQLKPTKKTNVATYLWIGNSESAPDDETKQQLAKRAKELRLDEVCQWELVADTDSSASGQVGRVTAERALDCKGKMVYGFVYSPLDPEKNQGFSSIAHFVGPDGMPMLQRPGSAAEYVAFKYDPFSGWEMEIQYRDANNTPVPGPWRVYGQKIEHAPDGRTTGTFSVDAKGNRIVDQAGNCGMRDTQFDAQGHVTETRSYGPDGGPMPVTRGYSLIRYAWDSLGRLERQAFFDAAGNPVVNRDREYGCHMRLWSYDSRGNQVSQTCIGVDGKHVADSDGCAVSRSEYDASGNVTQNLCFGAAGTSTVASNGFHGWRASYDARANQTEFTTLAIDGSPSPNASGVASFRYRYDDDDNQIAWAYFDAAGKPTVDEHGYHAWSGAYDYKGQLLSQTWLGLDGTPTKGDAYATIRSEYDPRGNEVKQTYFGVSDQPVVLDNTYHGWRAEYDSRGNLLRKWWFGLDELPVKLKQGFASETRRYDATGNVVERKQLGLDGSLAKSMSGYAKETAEYDNFGNQLTYSVFDEKGSPVDSREGYHTNRSGYDQSGRLIATSYFQSDGQPVVDREEKAHLIRREYDRQGRAVALWRFGKGEEPILGASDGTHGWKATYDDQSNQRRVEWFDAFQNRIEGEAGFSVAAYTYDPFGRVLTHRLLRNDSTLIISYEFTYDAQGARTATDSRFDKHGKLEATNNGCAKVIFNFDQKGNLLQRSCFGADGKPALAIDERSHRTTGHRTTRKYDRWGRETEVTFFDTKQNLMQVEVEVEVGAKKVLDVYARKLTNRDAWGRVLEESYFGSDGKPLVQKNGCATVTQKYNPSGKVTAWACFGASGEPATDQTDGTHKYEKTYDEFGRVTEVRYFDTKLSSVASKLGYARVQFAYDAWGNDLDYKTFGVDGKPVTIAFGQERCARIAQVHDRNGRLVEQRCYDSAAKIVGTPVENARAIVITKVLGGQGTALHLQKGDVLWNYGDWKFRCRDTCPDLEPALDELRKATRVPGTNKRQLIVLRNFRPVTVQVDSGWLGVEFDEDYVDLARLRKASK